MTHYFLISVIWAFSLLWIAPTHNLTEPTIAEQCQNNTVVVTPGRGHGSGVLFTRTDATGNEITFVWTVGHVAHQAMKSNGTFRKLTIISGNKYAQAIVLRANDFEIDHDIALLQIINSDDFHGNAKFYRTFNHVKVGQPIIHVGTPRGKLHERSVFLGNVSYVNRLYNRQPVLEPRLVDQIDVTIDDGCSGGGVFDAKTGGILGFATITTIDSVMFITPTRYIYEWAKSHDCLWAFDHEVPLPTEITPWRSDVYTRIVAERDNSEIDACWGDPEPEPELELKSELELESTLKLILESILRSYQQ